MPRAPSTQSFLGPAWEDSLKPEEDLVFLDALSRTVSLLE
jgi:hypothetical protein